MRGRARLDLPAAAAGSCAATSRMTAVHDASSAAAAPGPRRPRRRSRPRPAAGRAALHRLGVHLGGPTAARSSAPRGCGAGPGRPACRGRSSATPGGSGVGQQAGPLLLHVEVGLGPGQLHVLQLLHQQAGDRPAAGGYHLRSAGTRYQGAASPLQRSRRPRTPPGSRPRRRARRRRAAELPVLVGSSSRASSRWRCSSLEMCRNTLTTRIWSVTSRAFEAVDGGVAPAPGRPRHQAVHADDEHVLVAGAVEHSSACPARAGACGSATGSRGQLLLGRGFEGGDLAALGVDLAGDMADHALA